MISSSPRERGEDAERGEWGQWDGGRERPTRSFTNRAEGHARVGMQGGVVNGDVHIYDVLRDSPEEKYRVALNCLDGNMPRRAEDLISEAVEGGLADDPGPEFTCDHVAYHWELAILSGRSFDHIGPGEFASIQRAANISRSDQPDDWAAPLLVVNQLVNCLLRQEKIGSSDLQEFSEVLAAFEHLQKPRRDEIRRHLEMILVGGIQDQMDAIYAHEVRIQRTSADRSKRVWKFFHQIPEQPRAKPPEVPVLSVSQRALAICSGVVAAAGLSFALSVIMAKNVTAGLIVLLLLAAGGWATAHFGIIWLADKSRLADAERVYGGYSPSTRYQPPAMSYNINAVRDKETSDPEDIDEEGDEQARQARSKRAEFRRLARSYVRYRFEKEAPDNKSKRRKWFAETKRVRDALSDEIIKLYDDPPTEPGAINWLIKWRVKRLAESWRAGNFHNYRQQLKPSAGVTAGTVVSVTVFAAGMLMALVEMILDGILGALLATILAGLGFWLLRISHLNAHLVLRRRLQADQADCEHQHQAEEDEYERWRKILEDQPSDAEMARWLDYDKMYVKTLAMNQYGLVNRDLIAHAVLTEPGYWRRRARVLNGPWRYSAYAISLFLLTEAGVRLVTVDLDFATGVVSNQRRMNFRYDAIAGAQVAELGIRFDGGRREIILLDENDRTGKNDIGSLILAQGFRLSFVNGRAISVVIENFDDGLIDRMQEDPHRLFELALDASGVSGALRVLEAIAAEGREWIAQERARRRRRLVDFQKRLGPTAMLMEAPSGTTQEIAAAQDTAGAQNEERHPDESGSLKARVVKAHTAQAMDASGATVELSVIVGEELAVVGRDEQAGRAWARNSHGQEGWVPLDSLESLPRG